LANVESVLMAQDEPYGSASVHAQYEVFQAASLNNIKVMLDGQGADELLAGYHGCFHFHYRELAQSFRLAELTRVVLERKSWHGLGFRQQLSPYLHRLPAPLRLVLRTKDAEPPPLNWLSEEFNHSYSPANGNVLNEAMTAEGMEHVRTVGDYCHILTRRTSLPMLLRYEDRNSMHHGVEARVPFLDHRLVEFCLQLGSQHKIFGGDTKRILRRAMVERVPQSILKRRDKIGFATPEEQWFKGPLKAAILQGLEETLVAYPDYFDPKAVRRLANDMLDGTRRFDFKLWRIVLFGIWGRANRMS